MASLIYIFVSHNVKMISIKASCIEIASLSLLREEEIDLRKRGSYHLLLHVHLFRVFSKLLQNLLDSMDIHACIDLLHHIVYSFKSIYHSLTDLSC